MKKLKFVGSTKTKIRDFIQDIVDFNCIFEVISETDTEWRVKSDNNSYGSKFWDISKSTYKNEFVEIPAFEIKLEDELFEI